MKIPTYIINLESRLDRKCHSAKQFNNRPEFDVTFVKAIEHRVGSTGLWLTIKKIVESATIEDCNFILICQDDHDFTKNYTPEVLFECINEAKSKKADVLAGGISWYQDILLVSERLFWTSKFTGAQFLILFKSFFHKILEVKESLIYACDLKISNLSDSIFIIHPFISIQQEFGYSDVTEKNSQKGVVDDLFKTCSKNLEILKIVYGFYKQKVKIKNKFSLEYKSVLKSVLSAYIISSNEPELSGYDITFNDKKRFDCTFFKKQQGDSKSFFEYIQSIVKIAISKDEDVIVVTESNCSFSNDYSHEILLKNIFEGYIQGIDYLDAGTNYFDFAVPISANKYWANHFETSRFVIIYKKFYNKIIETKISDNCKPDFALSIITQNKMFLYPSIVLLNGNKRKNLCESELRPGVLLTEVIDNADVRLKKIDQAYRRFYDSY